MASFSLPTKFKALLICLTSGSTSFSSAEFSLNTVKLYNDVGYLWFDYSKEVINKKTGESVDGSSDIPVRLSIAKDDNNEWTVITYKEAP